MSALILAAAAAMVLPNEPTSKTRVIGEDPASCRDVTTKAVDPYWREVPSPLLPQNRSQAPRRLIEEPGGVVDLAVDRRLDGCRVRTIVTQPVSASGPRVIRIVPEGALPNRR